MILIGVMTGSSCKGETDPDFLMIWRGHEERLCGNPDGSKPITQIPAKQGHSTLCGDIRL